MNMKNTGQLIKVYNRDTEVIPEALAECIVYWRKGTSNEPYYKGEIYGTEGFMLSVLFDVDVDNLIEQLKSEVKWCAECEHLVHVSDIGYSGTCEVCEGECSWGECSEE